MPNDLPPLPDPEIRSPDGNGFSYAQVREIQAIARAEGREEMREWKASRVRDEALDCLTMIRDWPVDQWQDWQLATRTMAAMARKALERAAEEQIE